MGRQRAPPPPSSSVSDPEPPLLITPENFQPPNPLQFDLQTHKEATAAQFEVLRESVEFVKNQQAQFRAELLDEFRQIRLGSKSIEGQPSTTPHSVNFSSSSSSPPSSLHVLSTTSTQRGTQPINPLQTMTSVDLMVSGGLQIPLIPSTTTFSNYVPITFGSLHGDLSGMNPISNSIPFTSASVPNYHIPTHPYKPNYYHSEPLYATRPTVYPQFQPYPYTPSYVGPSNYHNLDPPNYQFNDHTFGFSPQFHQPISLDPNLPTMKQMRLDFPIFGGGDPVEWLNKAEQYFMLC